MADEKKKFRLGLVGCGRISQTYIEAIKEIDDIQLVGVMDVRKEATEPVAEVTGCKPFNNLDALMGDCKLDGVIVCAPPVEHRPSSCQFLQNGISVLCEKPLAITMEDGIEMYKTAEENNAILMMASKFRYAEDIIRAKSIIASEMLGNIHFYQNRFCSKISMSNRWNVNPKISGGGVLIDNGPHSLDVVHYLIGPIEKIYAHECKRTSKLPVEDTVTISFITENNIMGTIHLSWSIEMKNEAYINIYGTEGSLRVGWVHSAYQHNGHSEWVSFGVGYKKVRVFRNQINNFVETVRGTGSPLITSNDGLTSIRLIKAAYDSLKGGEWVSVKEEKSGKS